MCVYKYLPFDTFLSLFNDTLYIYCSRVTCTGYRNGRSHLRGAAPQGLQQGQDGHFVQGRMARTAIGRRAPADGACIQRHYVMARRQVVALRKGWGGVV